MSNVGTLQLTQKKTNLQFKALDQTLQTINRDTNQKEALSYRCADMDRIVPSLMGVSKVCCRHHEVASGSTMCNATCTYSFAGVPGCASIWDHYKS